MAFPRDENPYQAQLYEALSAYGVVTRYVGQLSKSHLINLLLLPLEVLIGRLRGFRLLHIHWTFGFAFTGSSRSAAIQQVSWWWYLWILWWTRAIGCHIVWTAHNVLPHTPVFADDREGRRRLIGAAALVIAHSASALSQVEAVAQPRRALVVSHGPMRPTGAPLGRRYPSDALNMLFFGLVAEYKGVLDLVEAFEEVAEATRLRLTIAGECRDDRLRANLLSALGRHRSRLSLDLRRIPDRELEAIFGAHDVLVLPYRQATTSGVAILGCEMGIPVVAANVAALKEVPAIRFEPGVDNLVTCLNELDRMDRASLVKIGLDGLEWARSRSGWSTVAEQTADAFASIVGFAGSRPPAAVLQGADR